MIDEILKLVGGFMISNAVIKEAEDWIAYKQNPTPENEKKAMEISFRSWNLVGMGLMLYFIGWIIEKKEKPKS